MRSWASKANYAIKILRQRISGKTVNTDCPYCGNQGDRVGVKKFLLTLYECGKCNLRYRVPKSYVIDNETFYDEHYAEDTVTDLPSDGEIENRSIDKFVEPRREFLQKVLGEVNPKMSLDYGCAWGYMVDWMRQRGVKNPIGFDISDRLAQFGRNKLGVEIHTSIGKLEEQYKRKFDLVYTAHVLEHLDRHDKIFGIFRRLIRPTGFLAIVVPNASDQSLRARGWNSWEKLIGEVHTTAFQYSFFSEVLPKEGFSIIWQGPVDSEEIKIIARKD